MKKVVMLRSNPIRPYPRLEKMANCIADMGHEVTVLAWDRDDDYKPREEILELKNHEIKIIRIGIPGQFSGGYKKNGIGLIKFESFVFNWLRIHRKEYDIIHAYDFDTGFIAAKAAQIFHKKLIYDIADYYVDSHGLRGSKICQIVEKYETKVINQADATIICTEERKKQISKATPRRLIIIHNTPDEKIYETNTSKRISAPSKKLKLVYVGILGRARFIDRISEVVSRRDDCEFHIGGFGGGLENYFWTMSEKYENIFFYGRMQYADTLELEKECDVMCAIYDPKNPNHRFAAPNKFYEALMLGKPLIMAENTGFADFVKSEGIGEVIEYREDDLNRAIDRMILNIENYREKSSLMKGLYSEKYSWEIMRERIEALYSSL